MKYGKFCWNVMTAHVLWLIICITLSAWAQEKKLNYAVIGFKSAEGVTTGEADIIADRLRIELFNTGLVNIMERDQMKEILEEQGFQQSGACTDEACMVEAGQLLGVKRLVSGSIGKLGKVFLCNFRSIDVKTGQIICVVSRDITGGIGDVAKHLPDIALQLAGKAETKSLPVRLESAASLHVTSIPEGAAIFLNDKEAGNTPYKNTNLPPGNYKIMLHAKGCKDIKDDITIKKDETITKEYKLEYKKEYLDSVEKARKIVKKRRQNIRRIVFGVIAAGTGGAGLYYNYQAQQNIDKQDKIVNDYSTAPSDFGQYEVEYNELGGKLDDEITIRNILYGVAGACTICLGISIAF